MRQSQHRPGNAAGSDEMELSDPVSSAYGRLLDAVRSRIDAYASRDGGLICEARTGRARPKIWRILPDGAVLPDSPYNFALRAFITAELPSGVSMPA